MSLSREPELPFTIGLDARKIQDFGIGTYVRNLVAALARVDRENRYVLLVRPADKEALPELPETFRTSTDPVRKYLNVPLPHVELVVQCRPEAEQIRLFIESRKRRKVPET